MKDFINKAQQWHSWQTELKEKIKYLDLADIAAKVFLNVEILFWDLIIEIYKRELASALDSAGQVYVYGRQAYK